MRNYIYVLLFLVFCFILHSSAQVTHPSEVDALRAVKKRLVDPKGRLKNWSKGDPFTSNWTGVLCYDKIDSDGFYHIKELLLLKMDLSGTLAAELGLLSNLEGLDFMWNQITGSIPKEIGKLSSLKQMVLNGNLLSGSLPDELGSLSNMDRLQLDENNLSGSIPKSFANMTSLKHFHLNNNSFSGQLPPELSKIKGLVHLLLDNNNLSGNLPSEFSALSKLTVLQLDNNHFVDAEVPESYQNLSSLIKLSLRNCSLRGAIPNFSQLPFISYIDLSWNKLTGSIPSNKLSDNITTIILSHNELNGSIPESFSSLPSLQMLSLENNLLDGSVPASLWENKSWLSIDLRYNLLSGVSGDLNPPQKVNIRLRGNPLCNNASIEKINNFCNSDSGGNWTTDGLTSTRACPITACPINLYYEPIPEVPTCFCSAPIRIGFRLKSPSFTYFPPYIPSFKSYMTDLLNMELYQLFVDSYAWEEGPRLRMDLKLFPNMNALETSNVFNDSELLLIRSIFANWRFPVSDLFGPYELLNFTLLGPYDSGDIETGKSGIKRVFMILIIIGVIFCSVIMVVAFTCSIWRIQKRYQKLLKRFIGKKMSVQIDGVKEFSYNEMLQATNNFDDSTQLGQGGYGKVYKGTLADDTLVAIKRAQEGSHQGTREFLTEIHLLSRLHHRNLVSLVGYCDENGEQMLVYEFMPNGTLEDWLSGKLGETLGYTMRLRIALGAANGILYLHKEANPPVFHRDIKASNILLDSQMIAKVADFGLSSLAPVLDDEAAHVSTVVKGTPGYLDPEYIMTQKLTDKSDVYSLGVVFLVLFTGVPPISQGKNLVREVFTAQKSGSSIELIDSRMNFYTLESAERFIALAIKCCQDEQAMRPSMLEVVRELEKILEMVPETEIMTMPDTSTTLDQSTSSSTSVSRAFPITPSNVSGSDSVTGIIPTFTPR